MSKSDRDDNAEQAGFVQSVTRALNLLKRLAEDGEGYRRTDLAERNGLSSSTVHRPLTTMEQLGFVQFDQSDEMWHVGRQSFAIGATFVRRTNFVAQMLQFSRRSRDQTREALILRSQTTARSSFCCKWKVAKPCGPLRASADGHR